MQCSRALRLIAFGLLSGAFLMVSGCDSTGPNGESDDSDDHNGSQNQPPTANVDVSSSMTDVGTQITLDGSGSSDPDGDDLTFNWTLSAPSGSNASLADPSAEQTTFTPDVEGDYIAELEVSDGDASDTDDATVQAQDGTTELNSDITSDRTLSADTSYLVTNTVAVDNEATLTIEAGTQIMFENDVALWINSGSALDANGASGNPITMTATDGNEQQGWWRGVAIYSNNANNAMEYVEIRHAGSNDMSGISEAASIALESEALLNLTNSTIGDGGGYGVYLDASDASLESFASNTFSNNTDAPMWIPFTNIGMVDAATNFADGTYVRVYGASLSNDLTISALNGDTPYRFSSRPETGSASVTVEPGVEMTFENDVSFWVNSGSALVADGTSSDPITMTATPGNEQQGWWRGIAFYSNNANNTLDYVEIRHAGKTDMSGISEPTNVALESESFLNLTNSTITDSGGNGVYCDASDASLSASGNTFSNNAGLDVGNCQ